MRFCAELHSLDIKIFQAVANNWEDEDEDYTRFSSMVKQEQNRVASLLREKQKLRETLDDLHKMRTMPRNRRSSSVSKLMKDIQKQLNEVVGILKKKAAEQFCHILHFM